MNPSTYDDFRTGWSEQLNAVSVHGKSNTCDTVREHVAACPRYPQQDQESEMSEPMDLEELWQMLRASGHAIYTMALGHQNVRAFQALKDPKPGDMVFETSTVYRRTKALGTVGRLVRTAREPMEYAEWDEESDGPKPLETVWYIQALDGNECRWTNCEFVLIPTTTGWTREVFSPT